MNLLSFLKLSYLKFRQDALIFKPTRNIPPMRNAFEYDLTASECFLVTEDNVKIHLWKKDGTPLFVVFHGNTGHFGSVGKPDKGEDSEYRINLLKEMEKIRAGYVAVSLRGYGKSEGTPSEKGFVKDIKAVIDHIGDRPVIILGESLGAASAMIMAREMTKQKKTPKIVAIIAAFSSMTAKVMDLHSDLDRKKVSSSLKHKFDLTECVKTLSDKTSLYIFYPENDMSIDRSHSKLLVSVAEKAGIDVTYQEISGGHITWDPKEILNKILVLSSKNERNTI